MEKNTISLSLGDLVYAYYMQNFECCIETAFMLTCNGSKMRTVIGDTPLTNPDQKLVITQ